MFTPILFVPLFCVLQQSDESGESGIRFVSDEEDDRISCGSSAQSVMPPAPKPTPRVRRISVGQPMHRPPPGEILTLQQNPIVPPSPPVHPQIQAILDGKWHSAG